MRPDREDRQRLCLEGRDRERQGIPRLLFKTTEARYQAVENAIRDMHSYELPAIYAVPCVTHLRALRRVDQIVVILSEARISVASTEFFEASARSFASLRTTASRPAASPPLRSPRRTSRINAAVGISRAKVGAWPLHSGVKSGEPLASAALRSGWESAESQRETAACRRSSARPRGHSG